MKKLKWPVVKEDAQYMRMRKDQNKARCARSKAEQWFLNDYISKTSHKFSRQACWGYRIFDFWVAEKGVAIEIDGPEHNKNVDAYRDKYNFLRSGIIVLRVPNFDDDRAAHAIRCLDNECTWNQRRMAMGIAGSKRQKRELADNGLFNQAIYRIQSAGLYCSFPVDPREQARPAQQSLF